MVGEDGFIQGGKIEANINQTWVMEYESGKFVNGTTSSSDLAINNATGEVSVWTSSSVITVGSLDVGAGGVVDLSYANTVGVDPVNGKPIVSYFVTDGIGTTNSGLVQYPTGHSEEVYENGEKVTKPVLRSPKRMLYVDAARLAEGATFRLGTYGWMGSTKFDNANEAVRFIASNEQDQVFIKQASQADPTQEKTKLYVQLGWAPGVGIDPAGAARNYDKDGIKRDTVVLGMLEGGDKFEVEGQTSLSDGIFNIYEITPVIGRLDDYFTNPADENGAKIGTAWELESYTFRNTEMVGESGKSAAENAAVLHNLWKGAYTNLFRHIGGLHRGSFGAAQTRLPEGGRGPADASAHEPGALRESVWGEGWHGKYRSAAGYGRSVSQTYNGIQAGYDKLLSKPYFDGKLYAGLSDEE